MPTNKSAKSRTPKPSSAKTIKSPSIVSNELVNSVGLRDAVLRLECRTTTSIGRGRQPLERNWQQTEESVMPLRDHFRPPLSRAVSWEGVHGQWPAVIVQSLGKILPDQFVAEPRVHLGSQVEVDIATFDTDEFATGGYELSDNSGGVATAVWAPTAPSLVVETELPDGDEYEVRVYDIQRARRLVAAVEIVSPANKDRPEHRRMFVAKCAALLQQHVSVVIVDVVTLRDFNLYAQLLEMLELQDPSLSVPPQSQYAVACRHGEFHNKDFHNKEFHNKRLLETWNHPLELGQPLPRLPLWLTDTFAVTLDLEESYEQTCRDLRLPAFTASAV